MCSRQQRSSDAIAPRQRLIRKITACWRTQALHAAVQLDLLDQLKSGNDEVRTLAEVCECAPDGMQRLLDALCVLQVCRVQRNGRYALTA